MRVVICDDSADILKVWSAILKHLGHEVVAAGESGHDAVKLCAGYKPDLALLDMSMGALSGDVAAVKIKEQGDAKRIIIATSRSAARDELLSKGLEVLPKPVTVANMKRILDC